MLVLLPDIGKKEARKRAKRLTGARPSKKLLKATSGLGWKEGAESIAAAVATAGIARAVGLVGEKLKHRTGDGAEPKEIASATEGPRGG
jgi:hypothetical protein